jgi:hypothetical protein
LKGLAKDDFELDSNGRPIRVDFGNGIHFYPRKGWKQPLDLFFFGISGLVIADISLFYGWYYGVPAFSVMGLFLFMAAFLFLVTLYHSTEMAIMEAKGREIIRRHQN